MSLAGWHDLDDDARRETLHRCCGCRRWVELVSAAAPFADAAAFHAAAEAAFDRLDRDDWLESFAHHPRIGDVASLRERSSPHAATADISTREQAGAAGASDEVLRALADGNARYHQRFGHVFLVCATGKTAEQMLALLAERIDNPPDTELALAAGEQRKITHIRIDGLLRGEAGAHSAGLTRRGAERVKK
ncbi:MAG TPA: 2-oxo-4-hydroxy-4-carboxy-5-ureidoimidazoline decarboxylase [Thermoanaerobaculia bacterium]|nr:2-oxo-4-hydroxy-4-carboxy-5-ureidoimidazoline decarboxylase [Thermoanaerobaculia bacterium]